MNGMEEGWKRMAPFRNQIGSALHAGYKQIPYGDLILTALGTAALLTLARRGFRRYRSAQDIPVHFFKQTKRLHGYAVLVNDSDNIRFYHRPWVRLWKPNINRQDVKYETINVRLAGIDAPEMAHFGGQPQPYAVEAKQWLTNYVEGRPVTIHLHRYDQYSRVVASVYVGRFWKKNVSLAMVQAGFATLYNNSGAEYGGIKEKLVEAETIARSRKKGMWKQDASTYTSPAEHKRKLKALSASPTRACREAN